MIIPPERSLAAQFPDVAKEWDYEKNGDLTPNNVTAYSHQKVSWCCENGHSWYAEIKARSKGNGCPYCSGRKAIPGETDLATTNPTLASEWDYEKNEDLIPTVVAANSNKKVWWRCKKGHSWEAIICNRNLGTGCPFCSGKRVIPGETDLATINPKLAEEWDYEKNETISPQEVAVNSAKQVWWKCKRGHSWKSAIYSRSNKNGCPYCSGRTAISGETDLATIYPQLADEWDYEKNGELSPSDVSPHSGQRYWWRCNRGHSWIAMVNDRSRGKNCPYCSGRRAIPGETDLVTINPQLAEEWNYEKNGELTPQNITVSCGKKVWWGCKEGHSWEARVAARSRGTSCPFCSGKRVVRGKNDLETVNSIVASEWDYEKNNGITPRDVTAHSDIRAWWKCNKGHSWEESISKRSIGRGCPYCSGRRVVPGETDFATLNPELVDEWDYYKNGTIKPDSIAAHSGKKIWWRCKNGHSWEESVNNRAKGIGCPYCSGHRVISGETDLITVNPMLAKEWAYEKNGELTPSDVTAHSNKNVWWCCNRGHLWKAMVSNRTKGNGCPYCSGLKVIPGETDLATVNPTLAGEWDYEKNGSLTPNDVAAYSKKRIWWRCEYGHSWRTSIGHRTNGSGCPYCLGRYKA